MKTLLLMLLLLVASGAALAQEDSTFIFPSDSDYPSIKKTGKKVSQFVPSKWKIAGIAYGDLNGDKTKDCAVYIKGKFVKFKQKNDGFGPPEFDTNPRVLFMLFSNPKTGNYELAEQTKSFIPIPESPTMEEPFEEMSIKNGVLKIHFALWFNAGSWSRSDTSYAFRLKEKRFVLIGADQTDFQRNSGEETSFSYNFLTGKVKISTNSNDGEMLDELRTKWTSIPSRKLRALSSFKSLYEWQPIPNHYL